MAEQQSFFTHGSRWVRAKDGHEAFARRKKIFK